MSREVKLNNLGIISTCNNRWFNSSGFSRKDLGSYKTRMSFSKMKIRLFLIRMMSLCKNFKTNSIFWSKHSKYSLK